jgi:hypothetical protein
MKKILLSKKVVRTIGKAVLAGGALLALVGILLSALALTHLRTLQAAASAPAPVSSTLASTTATVDGGASSACGYARASTAALVVDLRAFYRDAVLGNARFVQTGDWADFNERIPDLETAPAANAYLQQLQELRVRARAELDVLHVPRLVRELDAVLDLGALDALFMQTGSLLRADPWVTAHAAHAALAALQLQNASASDFAPRLLTWLANLRALAGRWPAYAARAVAAGNVHAHLVLTDSYDGVMGPALSADYTGFCAAVFGASAGLQGACLVYAVPLEQQLADFRDWWLNVYVPRAEELRPFSAPGVRALANGSAIYGLLSAYHGAGTGATHNASLSSVNFTVLAPLVLAGEANATAEDLARALANTSDTRFHRCTSVASSAAAAHGEMAIFAARALAPDFGFAPRAPLRLEVDAGRARFTAGRYDAGQRAWLSAGVATLPTSGTCGGGITMALRDLRLSALLRAALPGAAFRRALLIEHSGGGCAAAVELAALLDAPTAETRAWSLFAEERLYARGFFSTNLSRTGYAQSRALAAAGAALDACLHQGADAGASCGFVEAHALLSAAGATLHERTLALHYYLQNPGFESAVSRFALSGGANAGPAALRQLALTSA